MTVHDMATERVILILYSSNKLCRGHVQLSVLSKQREFVLIPDVPVPFLRHLLWSYFQKNESKAVIAHIFETAWDYPTCAH